MLLLAYQSGDPAPLTCDGATLQEFPAAIQGLTPPTPDLNMRLDTWLQSRTDRTVPVVVMVHGFMYDPRQPTTAGSDNPLETIYGTPPTPPQHNMTWLPVVGECDNAGNKGIDRAIGFTYPSEAGTIEVSNAGWSNPYQYAAFDQAPAAARALATILAALGGLTTDMRILAHSLGTRVVCQAVRLLRARMPPALTRVVLLDGAEFSVDAAASFYGCPFDVLNIVNRQDLVLQLGGEQGCAPVRQNNTAAADVIGYDGLGNNPRWIDLQIDRAVVQNWFANGLAPDGVRYRLDPQAEEDSHPAAGLDHWACYTNDGNRALVRDLLLHDLMTVDKLRALNVPDGTESPLYGKFDNVPIPLTPATRTDRQRLLAQAAMGGTAGGTG